MKKPKVVNVPEKMRKFYGEGTMLHPSIEEVGEQIKQIPTGELMRLDQLCKSLAHKFKTDVTCPMRTGNAIKKMAEQFDKLEEEHDFPFWRVIRSNNLLIKSKNIDYCAAMLQEEGISITFLENGTIKANIKEDQLYKMD